MIQYFYEITFLQLHIYDNPFKDSNRDIYLLTILMYTYLSIEGYCLSCKKIISVF